MKKSKVQIYFEELQKYCRTHTCAKCPYRWAGCNAVETTEPDTTFADLTELQIKELEELMPKEI